MLPEGLLCWFKDLILVLAKVLGAQSPPQPDSARFGVEVKGSQIAKGNNENEVQNNEGAPLQGGFTGVSIGGRQEAGKDNKNKVSGNKDRPPLKVVPPPW